MINSRKKKFVLLVVIFGFVIIGLGKQLIRNYPFKFHELKGQYLVHSKYCSNCKIVPLVSKPKANNTTLSNLSINLFDSSGKALTLLLNDDSYFSKSELEYNFQISELARNNHDHLITKRVNMGSGGGANYRVYLFRINDNLEEISGEIYSCDDPYLENGFLIFHNFGSHCDWLDTGSGEPETNKIPI